MNTNPRPIRGNWNHGWALDVHTLRSAPLDSDERGFGAFDTARSEIGEAVFLLKYRGDRARVEPIARTMSDFILSRPELGYAAAILAVPPSDESRAFQPVRDIAAAVGARLGLPVPADYLLKTKRTIPLKGVSDKRRRREELEGAFGVADPRFAGRHVLVVDDLFRSGETLAAVSAVLSLEGKVGTISVVTATVTRTRR